MIRYNNNTQTFPPNWCQNLDRVKTIAELTRLSALGTSDSFFDPSSIISPSSYIQHSTSVIRICLSLYLCHSHCPYQTVANVEIYVQQSAVKKVSQISPLYSVDIGRRYFTIKYIVFGLQICFREVEREICKLFISKENGKLHKIHFAYNVKDLERYICLLE